MTRDDIVAEARSWEGTPVQHQQSLKGVATDCRGFFYGVAKELGRPEANALTGTHDYSQRIDPRALKKALAANFDRTDRMEPGDLLLLVVGDKPKAQHLAMVTEVGDRPRMIHAVPRGPARVMEVPIGKSRTIDSIWTWRGLDG